MPALDGVRSDGLNLPYSLEAEQAVLGSVPVSYTHLIRRRRRRCV